MASLLTYPSAFKELFDSIPTMYVGLTDKKINYSVYSTRLSDLGLSPSTLSSVQALSSVALSYDKNTGNTYLSADNPSFSGPLSNVNSLVIYMGDDKSSLLCHARFNPSRSVPSSGDLELSFPGGQFMSIRLGEATSDESTSDLNNVVDLGDADAAFKINLLPVGLAENSTLADSVSLGFGPVSVNIPENVLAQLRNYADEKVSLGHSGWGESYHIEGYPPAVTVSSDGTELYPADSGYNTTVLESGTLGAFVSPATNFSESYDVDSAYAYYLLRAAT